MSDPTRTTVHVDVPKVDNVIEVSELLAALRDFAAQQTPPSDSAGATELNQVRDLAAQLTDLVAGMPDIFHRRPNPPPQP
ncbi:hypothetical protein JOD57_003896 [Geodermatophilus bullaregiensis]|uniref:hypothetical protein n=1 Tax=Geodermatophilus bullaregiensis TaxID=1564160 RepID=UPI00195EF13D|nr:hypothetical protein [Geodermatophilus bullaregiensis]MBM7808059.1 hypothetical protein [Geodermatophilus bullaregiensis]